MIPDAEVVIGRYLREATGERIGGSAPPKEARDTAWVRLSLLDDPPAGRARLDHLTAAYVQLDVYAGASNSRSEASMIARRLRQALSEIHEATHEGATVTGQRIESFRRDPDETQEPAHERYICVATVYLHA